MVILSRKRCLSLLFCLVVTGCGTPRATVANFQEPSRGVIVEDLRPQEDKSGGMGSYWITSSEYGIQRLGDDVTSPSRIALLQRDLRLGLGDAFEQSPVIIKRYQIYQDNKAKLRRRAISAGVGGILGVLVSSAVASDDDGGGLSVEIDAVANEKLHVIRTSYKPGDEDASTALLTAMKQAHTALIADIRNGHPDSSGMASGQFRRFSEFAAAETAEQN